MDQPSLLRQDTLDKIANFHAECIGCMLCTDFCSFHKQNQLNPKDHSKALLDKAPSQELMALSYDCSACGYCQTRCPKDIDYKGLHRSIKEDLYDHLHRLPNKKAEKNIDRHQKHVFHPFFNHTTTGFTDTKDRKVFFPGCSLISCHPETVLETYTYLQEQGDNIGIMSYCCGKPTETLGKNQAFQDKFDIIREQITSHNIQEIITACPNCHMTLKAYLPSVKIQHISQAILNYGLPERLTTSKQVKTLQQISLHDPCPTRYETDIHEAVRSLLGALGLKVRERSNERTQTPCCGSGSMLRQVSPKAAEAYTQVFLKEFETDEPIVSYCQDCVQVLNHHHRSAHHFLKMIFEPDYCLKTKEKEVQFLERWTNRYKHKITMTP